MRQRAARAEGRARAAARADERLAVDARRVSAGAAAPERLRGLDRQPRRLRLQRAPARPARRRRARRAAGRRGARRAALSPPTGTTSAAACSRAWRSSGREQVAALHVCEWLEDLEAPGPHAPPSARTSTASTAGARPSAATATCRPTARRRSGSRSTTARSGLLAWIADKWLSWSDPACPLDDDLILTTVTIYWVTRTIAPSMRAYAADAPPPRGKVRGAGRGHRGQGGPAAAAARVARAQLRRSAQTSSALERGGHFWAAETPEQFARRLRGFLSEHAQL